MRKIVRFLAGTVGLLVLIALSIVAWLAHAAYGDRSLPVTSTEVIVQRGDVFSDIARELVEHGVIGNATAFRILAKVRHEDVDVRAGAYRFPPNETENEVLHALLTGGAQVATWVTIPEGFTAEQIAQRLQGAGVGRADELDHTFKTTSIRVGGAKTRNLEGYLFPSTYLVEIDSSPAQIVKQFTDQFYQELPSDAAARARALHITVAQGVTVASLIEREAKVDADRPMIAGVIYNRLRDRMPLQIDATIEYALPSHKVELSFADLKIDSPYNTYLHEGLPPTPIANPGWPSLEAAFHPSRTDALYYVYCGGGHHVFAKTLEAHQANVARCLK